MGLHWRICFLSSLGLPLCIFSFVSFVHLQSYSSFAFTFYFLCIFFPFFVSFFLSVFCSFSIFFFYCSCTWFLSSLWTCRQKSTFGCFFHLIFAAGTFGFCQSAYNIISNFCLLYSTYIVMKHSVPDLRATFFANYFRNGASASLQNR